jgi:hypothetical protein
VAYGFLADLVAIVHFCFVLFVMLGGFIVLWKPCMAWYHIPAVIWAASIEFLGGICPLTPLENMLRAIVGKAGYATGFVEHYIMPLLYPEALTRKMQIGLGIIVLGVNTVVYLTLWQRKRKAGKGNE